MYNRLDILRIMLLSREGDRRENILLRQGKGWFQLSSMGHEALAALMVNLTYEDLVFPYPRDRAMMLARGLTTRQLAREFFAKRTSSSGDRQLQSHFSDRSKHVWSVPSPTASHLLPACGAAWAIQLSGKDSVVLATTGDAGCRQGEFYEAFAFAVERNLPIIFVIEDNGYGISTCTKNQNPLRIGVIGDASVTRINGRDPDEVYQASKMVIENVRVGAGPAVLWCEVDRLGSHTSSDDQRVYRSRQELSEIEARDPMLTFAQRLIEEGLLPQETWNILQDEIRRYVDAEYVAAEKEEDPYPQDTCRHLFGPTTEAPPLTLQLESKTRMVDALNTLFEMAVAQHKQFLFFGEDIEDPKGGVFHLTAGLSSRAPDRVFNSPLAEATILGVACGLATVGFKPIVELQFVDFIGPAFNQLMTNLATLRWRSFGSWTCPVIVYAPYGAYLPGGSIWHSQANEALFAHIPGIRVVIPSTPEDVVGLTWSAMHGSDPTIILLPKHLLRVNMECVQPLAAIPLGQARIRHAGRDVTLVTWGNGIELALQAALSFDGEVSIEVIDLRSIAPWDRVAVSQSLEKTGRLVVLQEDARSCSVGQMIISELTSDPKTWNFFLSPPQLVSRDDVHIGFNPTYENCALPDLGRLLDAIQLTMT